MSHSADDSVAKGGRQVMSHERSSASREGGYALILAILSLMLLTFLGLTLATTTSTELQIATNFRWSQQALYNAEAGLEAAKLLLADVASANASWARIVPAPRSVAWAPPLTAQGATLTPPLDAPTVSGRDYERSNCADRSGIGYGVVLRANGITWQDVSAFRSTLINGAFTIWVRRELVSKVNGTFTDDTAPAPTSLVITAEGVAPYTGATTAFSRANQARRTLEMTYALILAADACMTQGTQEGAGPTGENFNACSPLTAGATGSLASTFGGRAGAGNLTALP